MKLYPMLLAPALKETIWGGKELYRIYRKGDEEKNVGESWELSCRDDLKSVILNGELKGKTLTEAFRGNEEAFTGKKCTEFPWLIKFINAADDLSVQVHPDDLYAKEHGDASGKTEMWYILSAKPQARLIMGFKEKISREELKEYAYNGSIADVLNSVEVKKGDCFFIPSGMVHAIGKGITLLEVQQNSDATYRLYDWQRTDSEGKMRELHVDKAADVSKLEIFSQNENKTEKTKRTKGLANGDEILAECEYFTVIKRTSGEENILNGAACVIVTEGKANAGELDLKAGDTVFIPFECKNVAVKISGEAVIVY